MNNFLSKLERFDQKVIMLFVLKQDDLFTDCNCPSDVQAVCAQNGMTFINECFAKCNGLKYTKGPCNNSVSC